VATPEHGPVGALAELAELLVGLRGSLRKGKEEEKSQEKTLEREKKKARQQPKGQNGELRFDVLCALAPCPVPRSATTRANKTAIKSRSDKGRRK